MGLTLISLTSPLKFKLEAWRHWVWMWNCERKYDDGGLDWIHIEWTAYNVEWNTCHNRCSCKRQWSVIDGSQKMISSAKRIAASRSNKFKYALCKINIGDGGCKHWMMVRGQPPKTGGEWHCLWKYIDWGYHRGKLNILAEDKFMVAHVRLSYLWRTWKGGWLWYRAKIVDIPLIQC